MVGGMTLVSRITGLIRDIAFAQILGSGAIADAFFVAFPISFKTLNVLC
jgi:putative peptidoglycan lipid II flippase